MNILTDELPKALNICGEVCPIRYDFKTWIKFTQICSGKIGTKETVEILSLIFYKLPKRFDKTLEAIMEFYAPKKLKSSVKSSSSTKKFYDFDFDSDLIYSAFLQQYKIDLCTADLHWHQFKSLFDGLTDNTQFVKVLQYRNIDLSKIKDKEQKKFYAQMKELYRLPDNRTEEEKEKDLNNSLSGLF